MKGLLRELDAVKLRLEVVDLDGQLEGGVGDVFILILRVIKMNDQS